MTIAEKMSRLEGVYDTYDFNVAPFKSGAACAKGCSFCCSDAGRIDVTTLEALAIGDVISRLPRARQTKLRKALAGDMKRRLAGASSACPFLMKNNACEIYPARPFSCRRIYSLHRCDRTHPPKVHRQAMVIAGDTIGTLQRLDDTGYSGHISVILFMTDQPQFMATYRAGAFCPEEISVFGKTHGIVINRIACAAHTPSPADGNSLNIRL